MCVWHYVCQIDSLYYCVVLQLHSAIFTLFLKIVPKNTNKPNDFYLWVTQRITEHKQTHPLLLFTAFCLNIFPLICHLFICFLCSHFLNLMGDFVSWDEKGWRFLLLHEGNEPSLELNLSEMHCEYASGKMPRLPPDVWERFRRQNEMETLEVCNETTSAPASVVWQPGVFMFVHSHIVASDGHVLDCSYAVCSVILLHISYTLSQSSECLLVY